MIMSIKKIKRQARKLLREGSLYGFNFEDLDITRKSIKANGDFSGLGEIDLLVNFNKRAKVKSITASIDYDDVNARLVQSYAFSKYKKYSKAITSPRYEDLYSSAINNLNSVETFQQGVDQMERLPGVKDVQIQFSDFSSGSSQFWS